MSASFRYLKPLSVSVIDVVLCLSDLCCCFACSFEASNVNLMSTLFPNSVIKVVLQFLKENSLNQAYEVLQVS